jgi:hypothetical protein
MHYAVRLRSRKRDALRMILLQTNSHLCVMVVESTSVVAPCVTDAKCTGNLMFCLPFDRKIIYSAYSLKTCHMTNIGEQFKCQISSSHCSSDFCQYGQSLRKGSTKGHDKELRKMSSSIVSPKCSTELQFVADSEAKTHE